MRSRTVTRGEGLPRDDERCGVRPKVLEEVGKAVEEDEGSIAVTENGAVTKALGTRRNVGFWLEASSQVNITYHDDEDDGEHRKAQKLDRLPSPLQNPH